MTVAVGEWVNSQKTDKCLTRRSDGNGHSVHGVHKDGTLAKSR